MSTIESLWNDFEKNCLPDKSVEQRAYSRDLFYAGVASLLDLQNKLAHKKFSQEEMTKIVKGWGFELTELQSKLHAKNIIANAKGRA